MSLNWEFQLDGWFRKMPDGGFRQSARIENWKVVRYGINSETELYDLKTDISGKINIAIGHPKIIKQMNELLEQRTETPGFLNGGIINL